MRSVTEVTLVDYEVINQSPPNGVSNAWRADPLLTQLGESFSKPIRNHLETLGRYIRTPEAQDLAHLANTHSPQLKTYDRYGRRVDSIDYHPAYHALMRRSISLGIHSSIWEESGEEKGKRHQIRAVRYYLLSQLEVGHLGPLTMTSATLAALMSSQPLFRVWAPRVISRNYDHAARPSEQKKGATLGLAIAERQGGTDLQSHTTSAVSAGRGLYRINGHKSFVSAPMSDAFLVHAQAKEGSSCFLVPRLRDDGMPNGIRFRRLKQKIGNLSNASIELEISDALGYPVGEIGAGQRTITDVVTLTRLDNSLGSAGLMRAALSEAVNNSRHRKVSGHMLIDQPVMTRVLADLALDVAAATALSVRLARSFDEAANSRSEAAYARVMTPVVKYWVSKLAPTVTAEAMECFGGNGYIDGFPVARYYRDAPVSAMWEGSGNIAALDVLRILLRNVRLFEEVLGSIYHDLGDAGPGTIKVLSAAIELSKSDEGAARFLTEQLAIAAAAAELRRIGSGRIADAFIETRLAGQWRSTYGMLDIRHDSKAILDMLYPDVG